MSSRKPSQIKTEEEKTAYKAAILEGMSKLESLVPPKAVNEAERTARAIELRRRGYNFTEIAKTCGFKNERGAYNAVRVALERTLQEPAEELRTLESQRLDAALRAIWDQVLAGSIEHIKAMILIMERRAKLLGLDTPPKQAGITLNFIDLAMQAAKAIDQVPNEYQVERLTEWANTHLAPTAASIAASKALLPPEEGTIKSVVPARQKPPTTSMTDIYRRLEEITDTDVNTIIHPKLVTE